MFALIFLALLIPFLHFFLSLQTRADSQELDQFLKQEVEKFTRTLRNNEAQHSGEVSVMHSPGSLWLCGDNSSFLALTSFKKKRPLGVFLHMHVGIR